MNTFENRPDDPITLPSGSVPALVSPPMDPEDGVVSTLRLDEVEVDISLAPSLLTVRALGMDGRP